MNKVSFEKEFPSIKKIYVIDDETASVYITDVMKCCLDKARVKEAILNATNVQCRECELPEEIESKLLKELGLGDE